MKLESRVEALELELKILKNEIQATLLEIREQILNHYYPELRAEEPPLPPARGSDTRNGALNGNGRAKPAPAAKGTGRGDVMPTPPFSDIFLQDLDEDSSDLDDEEFLDEEPLPPAAQRFGRAMTRVALGGSPTGAYADDEEDEAPAPARRVAAGQAPKRATPPAKPARRAFAALAAWVGEAVGKVGKARTLQVVETYAAGGGALDDETASRIRRLVALAQDDEPATPAGAQEMMGLLVQLDEILAE